MIAGDVLWFVAPHQAMSVAVDDCDLLTPCSIRPKIMAAINKDPSPPSVCNALQMRPERQKVI